jgi:hypothetical protein
MTTDVGPTADQVDTIRRNILDRVAPSGDLVAMPAPRRRRTSRRIGFAAIGVGGLAAALIVTSVVLPIGAGGRATAEATEFLDSAATATIETSDPVVEPGQYLRIATNAVYGASTGEAGYDEYWLAPSSGVLYIPAERSDEWVWERHPLQPTVFFGNTEGIALQRYQEWLGDPDLNAVLRGADGKFYDSPRSDHGMDTMPRNPSALRDYFYDNYTGGSASVDEDVWVRITDLLRTGEVPADLRAALYRAIALIPGVEIIDDQAALDGRTGVALGRVEPARGSTSREEIIIDPKTGLMIGERTVTVAQLGEIPPGTVISSTSIETSVVDSAP